MRKQLLWLIVLFAWLGCRAQPAPPPNILLIVSDDQRYDSMFAMPQTVARIFDEGVTFERAYVTTSRCCPSRASILTGMYAHTHGVIVNSDPLQKRTMVADLHDNGYRTGLVGKYLNSYPLTPEDPPRPEFDSWVAMISGPNYATYFDTALNVNGTWQTHTGYQSDILQQYALDFLQQAMVDERPFFLLYTPYTPHLPALPAPGDDQLYLDLPPYNPPNFSPVDMSGKPAWMQALPMLTPDQVASIQGDRLRQIQSLNALDNSIAALLDALAAQGELDNTLVIYLSDNGLFQGEHRLPIGKIYVYEESTHVPLAIRYPALIDAPRVEQRVVGNIDIAPTIYDVAGIPMPAAVDGLSLRPLLTNDARADWRSHLLIEGWPINVAYVGNSPNFRAVHTGQMVYVETDGDTAELYDLTTDPYQITNLIADPQYAAVLAEMQAAMGDQGLGIGDQ